MRLPEPAPEEQGTKSVIHFPYFQSFFRSPRFFITQIITSHNSASLIFWNVWHRSRYRISVTDPHPLEKFLITPSPPAHFFSGRVWLIKSVTHPGENKPLSDKHPTVG
jgi:hypothetical protein